MNVEPSLLNKLTLLNGETIIVKHNLVETESRDLKRVIIEIVTLVLNVLRIYPVKLDHLLYTFAT